MNNLTLSVIGNQIFSEIINELKLFSKFKIEFYENIKLLEGSLCNSQIVIFFENEEEESEHNFYKLKRNDYPIIFINNSSGSKNMISGKFVEKLNMPFKILDLEKKVVSLLARYKFKKNSFINLKKYKIDRNERKIKKDNLELQLTEKETNFLILFSKNKKPLSRDFVLKNVWDYSPETDTHTVETHIHRLRKKILEKFGDNNFIKNCDEGYYI